MTIANQITIVRILLVPFFVVQTLYYTTQGEEWHRWAAIISFVVAAASDGLDGYVARRFNQRTELGALLDPLADKLLLVSSVILLSFSNDVHLPRFPLWYGGIVLGRDLMLVGGLAVMHYLNLKAQVQPILLGKLATVLQMGCIVWALFKWPDGPWTWLLIASGSCTAFSGLYYLRNGLQQAAAGAGQSKL